MAATRPGNMGGARIALLEARMTGELAALVRTHGGEPICVPAVREIPMECSNEVLAFLDRLADGAYHAVIFLTGAGVRALIKEAEKLGRDQEMLAALRTVTTICRGPKPSAVLKQNAIPISLSTHEPFTTKELLEDMAPVDLKGRRVCLLHYGQRAPALTQALAERGAMIDELCLYEWQMPEDTQGLKELVRTIIRGDTDSVAFTSQVQIQHLFQAAAEIGAETELEHALNSKTLVASIGPTTTACLLGFGVTPRIEPEHPKMGYLINALARHFSSESSREPRLT
jgi:uroporphyrinogen-III synthase